MPRKPDKPFKDLTKRHRDFVKNYLKCGDAYQAYIAAGYKAGRPARKNARLMQMQLQDHIHEQLALKARGAEMGILGLNCIADLAQTAESEAVRLNAAKELLSRAIPEEAKEVHHHHTSDKASLSDTELLERIQKLQDKLFIDAQAAEVVHESRPSGVARIGVGVGGTSEV